MKTFNIIADALLTSNLRENTDFHYMLLAFYTKINDLSHCPGLPSGFREAVGGVLEMSRKW